MSDNFRSNNSTVDKLKELFDYIEQGDSVNVAELLGQSEISQKSMNIAFVKAFVGYKVCESTREIAMSLLKYKADPDAVVGKSSGVNALLITAQENDLAMAKILLSHGAKINYKDIAGKTALTHLLASVKHQDIEEFVGTLLAYHIDTNASDNEGNSPLILATLRGNLNVLKMLCEGANVDVDYVSPVTGNTAIHFAVIHNRFDIVRYLVSRRAKVTVSNKQGHTAIDLAMHMNRTDIYSYLAEEYNKIEETQNCKI
jgi:ankyrin repeat protein